MKRSEKLNSALELLEFKLNKELSTLVDMMQNKIENEKKLADLINYKKSYSLNNANKNKQTITKIKLNHKLMSKVQNAINLQQSIVEKMEKEVNEKIELLKKDRAQTKAVEKLIGRYKMQEEYVKNRKEQKELDNQAVSRLLLD